MLVTSIFSFSHNVFLNFLFQTCEKSGLCGNGLECCLQFVSIWTSLKFCPLVMSVTKKEMNKCMAEIYDPGGIRTRAAWLISQYYNH